MAHLHCQSFIVLTLDLDDNLLAWNLNPNYLTRVWRVSLWKEAPVSTNGEQFQERIHYLSRNAKCRRSNSPNRLRTGVDTKTRSAHELPPLPGSFWGPALWCYPSIISQLQWMSPIKHVDIRFFESSRPGRERLLRHEWALWRPMHRRRSRPRLPDVNSRRLVALHAPPCSYSTNIAAHGERERGRWHARRLWIECTVCPRHRWALTSCR